MLRGARLPLLALLFSIVLFAAALAFRSTQTPQPAPVPQPTPTASVTPSPPPPTQPPPVPTSQPLTGAAQERDHYREALVGGIQRINPLLASVNPVDQDISALIFEGLTRINNFGEPVPALAESWIISSDGLEYIVRLRRDVLWHDGTPFTAADVAFTMALLRDPRFPGAPELGAFWRTVETQQLDEHLIRFRLAQPLGAFLDRLSIGIVPEHALRGTQGADLAAHPFNLTPIGTGAYQLTRILTSDGVQPRAVELAAAPNYRARAAEREQDFAIRRITFVLYNDFDSARAALASGEVDGLAARDRDERRSLFELALTGRATLYNGIEPTVGLIIYNWQRDSVAFFREQQVRQALQTGLDRTGAVDRALANLAARADSPLIPGSWAHDPSVALPAYDTEAARRLLITASQRLQRRAGGTPTPDPAQPTPDPQVIFTFSILTPNIPSLSALAGEIATQWSGLGMRVSVESVPIDLYELRLRQGDFDAALVELGLTGSGDPDVYSFWHEGQYPDGENYGGAADRRISELLERARREPYNINRIIEYRRFQRDFLDRAIALPVYYPLFTYAVSPTISGVQLGYLASPASRFDSIGWWRFID
jgi:peptide/nickel transport system substrate-binding protein